MQRRLLLLSIALIALVPCLGFEATRVHAAEGQTAYFYVGPDGRITRTTQNSTAVDTDVFRNEDPNTTLASIPQLGQEWAEDVHCTSSGPLTGFGVGFSGTPADSFDVTMAMYGWAGDAAPPGPAIVGPWTFRVPFNTIGIGVSFPPGPVVGPDLWLGASFSDPTVGLWLHDPPQLGTSHNLYWNFSTGMQESFIGGPVANFVSHVTVDLPTPVEPTTWGRIKNQY